MWYPLVEPHNIELLGPLLYPESHCIPTGFKKLKIDVAQAWNFTPDKQCIVCKTYAHYVSYAANRNAHVTCLKSFKPQNAPLIPPHGLLSQAIFSWIL